MEKVTPMSQPNDGGAAFPLDVSTDTQGYINMGMSLGEWFAGQAIAGICNGDFTGNWANVAQDAFNLADAMLAVRAQRQGDRTDDRPSSTSA